MTRRTTVIAGVGAVLVVAVFLAVGAERRAAFERRMPAWLDTQQPPESLVEQLPTVSPAQSRAANGCPAAASWAPQFTAGARIRREYPDTLASSPHSFVRASVDLSGGV